MWVSDFWESLLVFPVSTLSFDKNASLNFWYIGCLTLSPWFNACKVIFSSLDKLSIKTDITGLFFSPLSKCVGDFCFTLIKLVDITLPLLSVINSPYLFWLLCLSNANFLIAKVLAEPLFLLLVEAGNKPIGW